ncbi:hypothetical protein [Clostridium sp. UBA1652]|uniref:hypothetical protein n=1 Tax=Clostridium sp. UBA1652 TaxID=1946348 RepID=UPI00257B100B|nr:hypothetical protein [Clostridium sp. UBA1652]
MYNDIFSGVDSIGGFFKRIGIIIIAIIIFFGYVGGMGTLTFKVISRNSKGYMLLDTSVLNYIMLMAIPILLVILLYIYFKFRNDAYEPLEYTPVYSGIYRKNKSNKIQYNVVFAGLFAVLLSAYLYGINNYYAVFEDRIEKHNLLNFKDKNYSYKDIEEVSIYVKEHKSGGSLYYKVYFKDGYKIDLSSFGSIYDLLDITEIVKDNNVKINIDHKHFNELVEDLADEHAKPYRILFEE